MAQPMEERISGNERGRRTKALKLAAQRFVSELALRNGRAYRVARALLDSDQPATI